MSFKVPNISEGNELSNPEIRSILLNIYDRLTKASTKEVGYELFLKLILKNLSSPSSIFYIISQLSEFIPPLSPKEKEPCLKLLSLVFFNPIQEQQNQINKKNSIYYQFLSPILSIIQSITKDSNSIIFPQIANTYAEIVQNIMPTDISYATEELNMEEKRAYEMLQGFCIYNMKQEEKANRIIGSLCLTKLVENCPVVLQEQYMKFIWDNIMTFIDTKNYTAKYELLNCLISLILGAEGLFTQYANDTLYKVLDFLTEDDWNKRKLALNVIYTLIFYCKDEVMPLKDHIINFLRVLKTDKVKEVREVCLLILQIFNENEPTKKKIEKEKSISAIINKDKIGKNKVGGNKGEIAHNTKNKSRPKTGTGIRQQKKNNKFFENNKKFSSNPFKDNSYDLSDNRKNNNTSNMNNITTYNNDSGQKPSISLQTKGSKENMNTTGAATGNSTSHNRSKGKKSNNFVNEKMVIKPDPNKSIFKAIPNPAFFKQGNKKSNDIVVMAKGKPIKTNQNINIIVNENNENKLNKNNFSEQNENVSNYDKNKRSYESSQENREEKKIDYANKDKENKNININVNDNMDDNRIPSKRNNSKEMKYTQKKEDLRYKNFFKNDNYNDNNENYNDNYNQKENEKIDEEEDNYKGKYTEKNYEMKDRNNYGGENENESVGVDQNIIQKLLKQMEFLDKGHMSLENMFDNIQIDTQEQIENLNANFGNLESKTNRLNKDLNDYYINGY